MPAEANHAETVMSALRDMQPETAWLGQRLIVLESVPSTMDVAADEERRGADPGTVVIAGVQTKGRGQRRRPWHTAPFSGD